MRRKTFRWMVALMTGLVCNGAYAQSADDAVVSETTQKKFDLRFKVGLGWTFLGKEDTDTPNYTSAVYGRLAYGGGVQVEYNVNPTFGLLSGAEYAFRWHKLESYYGGLKSDLDFKENYNYSVNYLAVPLMAVVRPSESFPDIQLGLVANFALSGKVNYERESYSVSSNNDESTSRSLDNLNSPVWAVRLGLRADWLQFEYDIMLGKSYENTSFKPYSTMSLFFVL